MNKTESLGVFISSKDIARLFGISKSGIFNMLKRGDFPEGIRVGRNRRWRLSEVSAWFDAQEAAMKGAVNSWTE